MKENRLKFLRSGVFDNLKSLEELWLQNNLLEVLEESIFKKNLALKNVFLVENKITSIHPNTFVGLRYLRDVSLRKNLCTDKNYEFNINDSGEIGSVLEITGYSRKSISYEVFLEEKCFKSYQEQKSLCDLFEMQNPRCKIVECPVEIRHEEKKCDYTTNLPSVEETPIENTSSSSVQQEERQISSNEHHMTNDEAVIEEVLLHFWVLLGFLITSLFINILMCVIWLYLKRSRVEANSSSGDHEDQKNREKY